MRPDPAALPEGRLRHPLDLADPDPDTASLTATLAARTAARLRLDRLAGAERRPVGVGAVLAAAAVGGRAEPAAGALLDAVPPPASFWDVLACHGVAGPVLGLHHGQLDPRFAEALLDVSPLTGVLDRPGGRTQAAAEELLIDVLLPDRQGRRTVASVWAEPPASPAQALWRGTMLDRLRLADTAFVLNVYETAMLLHRPGHLARVEDARAALVPPADLDRARPVARWWSALAKLERSRRRLLRERPGLHPDYLAGVRLHWQLTRLEALR
ncbi:hypothetical protein ACFVHB_00335 [Kitasatospora sp. NPDC127111]|uniref:hypothetical protein n=1 Tax=Kitasatospora sp. NPDC127111 TaxID=3345363 RepID=UPI00362562FD